MWADRQLPYTVKPDSGVGYIDQNAAHTLPSINPLEPLFLAIDIVAPDFDFGAIDIVTDRNNLRSKQLAFRGEVSSLPIDLITPRVSFRTPPLGYQSKR